MQNAQLTRRVKNIYIRVDEVGKRAKEDKEWNKDTVEEGVWCHDIGELQKNGKIC